MEISLVIPSTPNHFGFLDCILRKYEENTIKPNEVIVSVSQGDKINSSLVNNLKLKYEKSFDSLNIILNDKIVMEGPNRGVGSNYSNCEYITYHDSDDIPHPQRIEVIKHFFGNYDILHLNHSYTYNTKFDKINIDEIIKVDSDQLYINHFGENYNLTKRPLNYFPNPNDIYYGYASGFPVCGGPTTINRKVLEDIKWNKDKILSYDYDFCMDTLFQLKKSMVINSPLIWYNQILWL